MKVCTQYEMKAAGGNALSRLWYYLTFALCDLRRHAKATQIQTVVVAGICLPVLVLVMLKRGHVQELRRDLVESPTGRQIKLYCSGGGDFFPREGLSEHCRALGPIDVVVPDIVIRGCTLISAASAIEGVDLQSTVPGDPILQQWNCDILTEDEDGLLLTDSLADELGIRADGSLHVRVERFAANETGEIELKLRGILPAESSRRIAFVNSRTLDRIKGWQKGEGVDRWNLSPLIVTTKPRFGQYLLFTESEDPLTDRDRRELVRRKLNVELLSSNERSFIDRRLLPDRRHDLQIYRLSPQSGESAISIEPEILSDRTPVDDVVIPWCPPRRLIVDGEPQIVTGLTIPQFCWLRFRFPDQDDLFDDGHDPLQIMTAGMNEDASGVRRLSLSDGVVIPLTSKLSSTSDRSSADDARRSSVVEDVVVPVELLAQLEALDRGDVAYDPDHRAFLPIPEPVSYEEVRLFAPSIDDVPGIVQRAVSAGYGFQSDSDRIEEIHRQDASLQTLVNVVGLAVFSFGILTVTVVLIESTHQKYGTIGILRVMGASPFGLFTFVCLRAALIGCGGGFVAGAAAVAFGMLLNAKADSIAWIPHTLRSLRPDVVVVVVGSDFLLTVLVSTACCSIGAFFPALRAVRIDPVEAVIEGRQR